ncbi:hypothetical protein BJ322DRAFT_1001037 [Thelephora terrestris]|uniref:CxC1-like cysteine cluster associated with KDZ transposases domain-containing protein n=1 Tax=Thelephora terrestris TaxID=56493 RepID=A0A9P6L9T0_9AGAM|nr:hypothetical protein BJ322DRAFT_1001037 [Thelephora terrestris]
MSHKLIWARYRICLRGHNPLPQTTPLPPPLLTQATIRPHLRHQRLRAVEQAPAIACGGTGTNNPSPPVSSEVTILVIDIYTLSTSIKLPSAEDQTTVSTLASLGFIGNAPFRPSVAVSIKTLELYHVLRRRKPSFSIEAFVKVICDLYMIPYRPRYRRFFSDAFDAYLEVTRAVDKLVKAALAHDTPNWRVLNACPACSYELENEPELTFRRMFTVDGNDSLKRIARIGSRDVGDLRCFSDSDYYIPADEVDEWAREARSTRLAEASGDDDEGDSDDATEQGKNGDPDSGPCANNWKAAQLDSKKRMWGIFAETGLFASACQHGFILWITDMIRSGEQAKYPLAVIARALHILGPRLLIGYDIGCVFQKTISTSSLGTQFTDSESRCCVNAFHGYSHNFSCQTQNHPNVITGMGIEDLETMERIFSSSNQVAGVTRYASAYHCRVFIDMFFQQWDDEKYRNLASMLSGNYQQAISIIKDEGAAVEESMNALGISSTDLETWHNEQVSFFETVGEESRWDVHAMAYVELLQELSSTESQADASSTRFLNTIPTDYHFSLSDKDLEGPLAYTSQLSKTRRLETERRHARERHDRIHYQVLELEDHMGITKRWTPATPEYIETFRYISERRYHRALNNLQRLVTQRLFELHRLNLSGAGKCFPFQMFYANAIRNATEAYNRAVWALDPPRPPLDWAQVSRYSFLEEFTLLRNSHRDISKAPWADPVIRETIKRFFRVRRAHEEIQRCNVEIRRLVTSIHDEAQRHPDILKALAEQKSPVLGAVSEYFLRRRRVNGMLLGQVQQIFDLDGFTGDRTRGRRKGHQFTQGDAAEWYGDADNEDTEGEDVGDVDNDQIDGILNFVTSL